MLTPEEIRQRLPDPVFLEATGVLEMIARDPEQRSLYEARLKAERDSRANLDYASREGREQGREEGREEGRWEQRIRIVGLLRDIIG
jgi:flagellar biosynthesis/type III secretory pathway protein FliH